MVEVRESLKRRHIILQRYIYRETGMSKTYFSFTEINAQRALLKICRL